MKRIFLHIGLPKTGSTYIQRWLMANRAGLAKIGVWMPTRPIYAHRLAVEYIANAGRAARSDVCYIKETPFAAALKDLQTAEARPGLNTAILSSEYFFECKPRDVEPLKLLAGNHPVTVVVFLRRQDRLVESAYNQEVKAMGTSSLLSRPKYAERMNWLSLYERWAEVFGEDNIKVVNYDLVAQSKKLLAAFCEAVDIPATFLAETKADHDDGLNESLPANVLEFKRLANVYGEFGLNQFLARAIKAGLPTQPFRLRPDIARAHMAFYAESNKKLARRLHLRDSDEMFPMSDLNDVSPGADFSGHLPMETVVHLMSFLIRECETRHEELSARLALLEMANRA